MLSCDLAPSENSEPYLIPHHSLYSALNALSDGNFFTKMGFLRFRGREVLASSGTTDSSWRFLTSQSYPAGHVSYGIRDLRLEWMLRRIAVFQSAL